MISAPLSSRARRAPRTESEPLAVTPTFSEAVRRLPHAQKSAKGAPAYSRFVNRRLGGYLAAMAYVRGWTPNQVTVASAAFTFCGIGVLAAVRPTALLGALIAALLLMGYALDAADGQLARLRGGGSAAGEWLDHVIDALKIPALHLAVLVCWYRFFDLPGGYLLVPVGFAIVEATLFFAMTLNDQLRRRHGIASSPGARPSTLRSLITSPTDYGVICLAFGLVGFTRVFAAVYGLLFLASLGFLLAALRKWFLDMSALDLTAGAGQS